MKKVIAFIVSFAGAAFAFWVSWVGAYQVFTESKYFGFSNIPSLILSYLISCVIAVMVWFGWYDGVFHKWTVKK